MIWVAQERLKASFVKARDQAFAEHVCGENREKPKAGG
jgi:hypothetical protein